MGNRKPKTFATSDLHLGDARNSPYRGFDDVDVHDQIVIDSILETVAPGDDLWILGDISRGGKAGTEHAFKILWDIAHFGKAHMNNPIKLHLIPGNHDRCHPKNPDSSKHQRHALTVFDSVQAFARFKIAERDVFASHFPYTRDRHEERYGQYRLRDEGEILMHGHLHTTDRVVGREIHVGWDAWKRPASMDEIEALVRSIALEE